MRGRLYCPTDGGTDIGRRQGFSVPQPLCWSAYVLFCSKPINWGLTWLLVLAWHAAAAETSVLDPIRRAQEAPTSVAYTVNTRLLSGSPVAGKIASSLHSVVQRMHQDGVTAANVTTRHAETYSTPLVHVDTLGRVHTAILVTVFDTEVESVLTTHQITMERADAQLHIVQAWVPFDRLETVAALPFVRSLRSPSYASRR